MKRKQVSQETINQALDIIKAGFNRAIEKHGAGAFVGPHEGLGVLTEEYHELIDAVRSNRPDKLREEIVDVAASAIWMLVSSIECKKKPKKKREVVNA